MKVLLVLRKRWTMLFPDEKERGRSEMVKHIPGLLKHLRKLTMTVISLDLPFLIVLSCFYALNQYQVSVKSGRQSWSAIRFGFSPVGLTGFSSQASSTNSERLKVVSRTHLW